MYIIDVCPLKAHNNMLFLEKSLLKIEKILIIFYKTFSKRDLLNMYALRTYINRTIYYYYYYYYYYCHE